MIYLTTGERRGAPYPRRTGAEAHALMPTAAGDRAGEGKWEKTGKERKEGKEGKEGKERKGKERKGKERRGRSHWEMFARGTNDVELGLPYACLELVEGPRLLLINGVQPQGCAPGCRTYHSTTDLHASVHTW